MLINKESRVERVKWGTDHLERLIYREQLDYWRDLRKTWNWVSFPEAAKEWNEKERTQFVKRIEQGWMLDLVSSAPESLRMRIMRGEVKLMAAALEHDIDYLEGGGIIARFKADFKLAMNVIKNNKDQPTRVRLFIVCIVAPLMFLGVRLGGWRGHFCWGSKPDAIINPENDFNI